MAHPKVSDHEISVKVAGQQLEFLEIRAKELGISKEELVKLYIVKAIDAECEESQFSLEGFFKDGPPITKEIIDEAIADDTEREHKSSESKQFSLMGIIRDGRITDEDIEEVVAEWNRTESP